MRPPCITEASVSSYVTDVYPPTEPYVPHTRTIMRAHAQPATAVHAKTPKYISTIRQSGNRHVNDTQNARGDELHGPGVRFCRNHVATSDEVLVTHRVKPRRNSKACLYTVYLPKVVNLPACSNVCYVIP